MNDMFLVMADRKYDFQAVFNVFSTKMKPSKVTVTAKYLRLFLVSITNKNGFMVLPSPTGQKIDYVAQHRRTNWGFCLVELHEKGSVHHLYSRLVTSRSLKLTGQIYHEEK